MAIPLLHGPHNRNCEKPQKGPGYSRHRDYSGIHHGESDGLICVELSYPHTNFDR